MLYIINRLSPHGERHVASEVGGTAVFGEQLVFAQRLLLGMDDVFNLSS